MKLQNVRYGGMRNINTEGILISVSEPREVLTKMGPMMVCDAILGDDTGEVKMSLWDEDSKRFKTGDMVQIENAYTTTYRGDVQLSIGKFGTIKTRSS